ncbi:MAG: formate dehydrogenase accessory protein FdhE [Terriglobales bacterium]
MMRLSPWQTRIQRAEHLAKQYPFVAEILGFYAEVARFQEDFHGRLEATAARPSKVAPAERKVGPPELPELIASFGPFLSLVVKLGPAQLATLARDLQQGPHESWSELLDASWNTTQSASEVPEVFLARAFLQPYAEFVRSRLALKSDGYTHPLCPFCNRRPGLAVFRQQGDGARRSLMCSFCLAEWEFRRIVCAGCGEESNTKLPVYTASDFDYIRVEGCDTCHTYLKGVDLTKNGLAEPMVDEIAAAPLDLWAQEHGYSKLQRNLMGM